MDQVFSEDLGPSINAGPTMITKIGKLYIGAFTDL